MDKCVVKLVVFIGEDTELSPDGWHAWCLRVRDDTGALS
jgi:hypothetical protein